MRILIAGDFCSRYRTVKTIEDGQYEDSLGAIKALTEQSDYSIVNLECPILEGAPTPIIKQGPNLCGSKKILEAIKFMGFDCATLANNHFFDQGEQGVQGTIDALRTYDVDYVGGGKRLDEASKNLYKDINGERLAVINCCEHEFSIATETSGGANPLNPVNQYYAIREAKENADYVLVIVHGGHEHYQLPSPRMVETYRFFIDAGADAVINHHQHCYSGYEVYNGKPIFYGLGNLFFDTEPKELDGIWNYGFLVMLEMNKDSISYTYYPYKQCAEEPKIALLKHDAFETRLKEINETIKNPESLHKATESYYRESMNDIESFMNPYQNRAIRGLVKLGLLPTLFKKKWLLKLENYILCEAHRDKVEYYLKNK